MAKKTTFNIKLNDKSDVEVSGYEYGEAFVHRSLKDNELWAVTDKKSRLGIYTSMSYISAARFIAQDKSLSEICEVGRSRAVASRGKIINYIAPWLRTFRIAKDNFQSFTDFVSEQEA